MQQILLWSKTMMAIWWPLYICQLDYTILLSALLYITIKIIITKKKYLSQQISENIVIGCRISNDSAQMHQNLKAVAIQFWNKSRQ